MIVKPAKFQAMVINRFGKMINKREIYIKSKKITSEHSVKLLGNEIDNNQLNFDNHVSHYTKKQVPSQMLLVKLENTLVFLKKDFDGILCFFKF